LLHSVTNLISDILAVHLLFEFINSIWVYCALSMHSPLFPKFLVTDLVVKLIFDFICELIVKLNRT